MMYMYLLVKFEEIFLFGYIGTELNATGGYFFDYQWSCNIGHARCASLISVYLSPDISMEQV